LVDQRSWTEDELDIAYDIRAAISYQQLDQLQKICRVNPWVIREDTSPDDSETAWLSSATRRNNTEIVTWMLNEGFNVNPCTDSQPLSTAISENQLEMTKLLLSRGANANLDRAIISALNLRPEETAIEYATLLIEHGCDLNRVFELYGDSNNCFTALDWADKNPKLSQFLRKHGAKTLKEVRSSPSSPSIAKAATKPIAASKPDKPLVMPFDEVVAHFEKAIGPANKKSLIQIVPTGLPIGIHVIPPAGNRKHMTLFTNGLSAEPMDVPAGSEEYRFAELYIDLPGDWKIKEVKDMQWAWPLYWLRKMAQYPHNAETWLGGPVALIANEEPPRPLYNGCRFTTLLLFADSSFVRSDGMKVHLYRMIPLTTPEREYEQKRGLKAFMQALDKHDVPTIVDMNRKPFA